NLACQTGVTRFLQHPSTSSPLFSESLTPWHYDKTEDETTKSSPAFWSQFDYALVEPGEETEKILAASESASASGSWEVVDTVDGFAGLRIVRPGDEADAEIHYASQISELSSKEEGNTSEEAEYSSESDSSVEGDDVAKAEKWCEKALGPSRMREQDIWVQRLAETSEYADSHKKAFRKWQEVSSKGVLASFIQCQLTFACHLSSPKTSKLLQRMGDIDLERHGEVLVRLASLARDEDQALQYLNKALELSPNNNDVRYALIKRFWSRNCKKGLDDLAFEALKL
ncbi:dolichyl-P-Man:Man(7)GlcNAc(2)-PP-dolichol alpha-1,6-mannosyltransferase, partial [Aspergillus brasiliensis]